MCKLYNVLGSSFEVKVRKIYGYNVCYYVLGNPFKVKFRKHYCYKCKTELSIFKHKKSVSENSEDAKYYDFRRDIPSYAAGPCEYIHNVFYCPNCDENIEYLTQLSYEDVDIYMEKTKEKFAKKGFNIDIKIIYETKGSEYVDRIDALENVKNFCLIVCENNMQLCMFKFPLMRKDYWERPYYFKIAKKGIEKEIKRKLSE